MRQVSGSFPTWSTSISLADLWTFTLADGSVYRWTSWDQNLSFGGNTWSAMGPLLKRNQVRLVAGLEVDTLSLTIMAGETVLLGARTLPQAAAAKVFDGCLVHLDRAYMVVPGTVQAVVALFEGLVSEVRPSHAEVAITVRSYLERLNQHWPRNYWAPTCQHKLYGTGCGVLEAALRVTISTSGDQFSFADSSGKPDGYFTLGKATFTNGLNAGITMGIKEHLLGSIRLVGKLPAPVSGTVILAPGCDKAKATCETKFNNLTRFKGFPYVPKPETAR